MNKVKKAGKIMFSRKYVWVLLLLIICMHLYLLKHIIFFPYPELFIYPYLTNQGLLPYKQIFDQHFPGLMFFPINLGNLGMNTPNDARYWQFGTIIFTHLILYYSGKKIFKSEKWALFANLIYFVWQPYMEGYVLWIDVFVVPILLLAFYFLTKKSIFLSGLFLGVALLFKQVTLPLISLVLLYLFFTSKGVKNILSFLLGLSVPVITLVIWILKLGIWKEFIFWTVTFNVTTFAQMGRKYPGTSDIIKLLPVYGLSIIIIAYLLIIRKERKLNFIWIVLFFIGTLAFAYARFDLVHLQPSLVFALLILTYLIKNLIYKRKYLIAGLYVLVSILITSPRYKILSGSNVLFFGDFEKKVSTEINEITEPNDVIFSMGTFPHIYQWTETLPPGYLFVFQFPWFMHETESIILSAIISNPPKVIVRDKNSTISGIKTTSFMQNINRYIDQNYEVSEFVDSTEILLPK